MERLVRSNPRARPQCRAVSREKVRRGAGAAQRGGGVGGSAHVVALDPLDDNLTRKVRAERRSDDVALPLDGNAKVVEARAQVRDGRWSEGGGLLRCASANPARLSRARDAPVGLPPTQPVLGTGAQSSPSSHLAHCLALADGAHAETAPGDSGCPHATGGDPLRRRPGLQQNRRVRSGDSDHFLCFTWRP